MLGASTRAWLAYYEGEMLKRITLRGFKSFADADIELGPFTLIVGANASGKSNLRDALKLLHGVGLGYTLAEIIGEKYGPGGVLVWRGIRGGVREVATHGRTEFSIACDIRGHQGRRRHYRYRLSVDVSGTTAGPRVTSESLRKLPSGGSYYWDSNPEDDPVAQTGEHQIRV